MSHYNFDHLTQSQTELPHGPIPDDEALLLYGVIRVLAVKVVLELGGLNGYSATNFCKAVGPDGLVMTVEKEASLSPVAANHIVIHKDAADVWVGDIVRSPLDLIFFDCHDYAASTKCFDSILTRTTDQTILALHDTAIRGESPFDAERRLVGYFHSLGYSPICFHAPDDHPIRAGRYGITLMAKYHPL
jgi:predicted O-methyltransferase YrrM